MLMTFRYGVDGSWSAITIGVRTEDPQQWMDVMVSTVSSETWVVGLHGCGMFGEFIPFPKLILHLRSGVTISNGFPRNMKKRPQPTSNHIFSTVSRVWGFGCVIHATWPHMYTRTISNNMNRYLTCC
jgi:hypothetical protein